ncbi:LOW QUALITY PROTEIN: hypothetical protein Cgig2_016814 [Carnegiea gigantea]|uniref:DUF4283 domain-containing protein n=1 Tax=Carnegiea gigantea TaxID=171969 RepID=A0A9Q1JGL9_9CARY|nr:LOW QUALITY PROTEIN: hypothetical protein Cgig2_016814 [Carnegiea gigantea]
MARGRRKGRPENTQTGTSNETVHLGNETVHPFHLTIAAATPIRGPVSSYASLVNPNKGTSLNFIQAPVINGVECAKIATNDVIPEIEYWQSVILCSVFEANLPIEVMKGYLRRIWKSFDIDKICLEGVYLVHFSNLADQMIVVQKGVFFFDNKSLLVKPWNPEMDINTKAITSLPI